MFKTIVIAVDGSPAVERVLVYTEHMARHADAQVIIVHAYELPATYEWTESYEALTTQYEQVASEVAEDAASALRKAGIQAVTDVREGPAAEAILQAANLHSADLIIMGCRAHKRDSVSSAVLRYTYCPTLLVP